MDDSVDCLTGHRFCLYKNTASKDFRTAGGGACGSCCQPKSPMLALIINVQWNDDVRSEPWFSFGDPQLLAASSLFASLTQKLTICDIKLATCILSTHFCAASYPSTTSFVFYTGRYSCPKHLTKSLGQAQRLAEAYRVPSRYRLRLHRRSCQLSTYALTGDTGHISSCPLCQPGKMLTRFIWSRME